jgi:FKBP-type peptidyl-prolyl cis-trans isomerase FkpA
MTSRRHFVLLVAVALSFTAAGCGDDSPTEPTPRAEFSQTDLRAGTGDTAANGRRLTVHYTLWLYSPSGQDGKGRQIQTSVGGTPFAFTLGVGGVISGWDRGVPGMRVGGLRRLVLPPELAYGSAGSPPDIPSNATLVFEIDLLSMQ